MKRLIKKAVHDWNNRDFAILYVEEEVYEDASHAICLKRYMEDNEIDNNLGAQYRPEIEMFSEISKMHGGQDVILAHRVDNVDTIYYIYGLCEGKEISDNKIQYLLGEVYPEYKIVNDLEHDDNDNHGYDEESQADKSMRRTNEYIMNQHKNIIDKYDLAMDYDMNCAYNGYLGIYFYAESNTFCISSLIKKYNEDDAYELNDLDDIVEDVASDSKKAYETIEKLGYEFDETALLFGSEFVYNKTVPAGEYTLKALDQGLVFEFDDFSSAALKELYDNGIYEDEPFYMNELEEKTKTIENLI